MNLPSVYRSREGLSFNALKYHITFSTKLNLAILLLLFFFPRVHLLANSNNNVLFLSQAEYALMEGDSSLANFIFNYLNQNSTDSHVQQLCALRLSKKVIDQCDQSISIEQNIIFQKIVHEIHLLQTRLSQQQLSTLAYQKAHSELTQLVAQISTDHFFQTKAFSAEKNSKAFYYDYQQHVQLLQLHAIKASFYQSQLEQHPNDQWQQALSETYDILFFLQQSLFKKGLLNEKRKTQLRRRFNFQEEALLFYQAQYRLTKDKRWMQKILVTMENIKATLFSNRSTYHESKHLLKDLGRNILSRIEEKETILTTPIQCDSTKLLIYEQIQLARYYQLFYDIHQLQQQQFTKLKLKKITSICQSEQSKKAAVFNFFESKNFLFVLYINEHEARLKVLPKAKQDLAQALHFLKQVFSAPHPPLDATQATLFKFQQNSHLVYQTILAPFFKKETPEQLIIIPDGILNYIPFEALSTQLPKQANANTAYLVQQSAIRYYPNLKTLLKQEYQNTLPINIQQLSTFLPSYTNKTLSTLPASQLEVQDIHQAFPQAIALPQKLLKKDWSFFSTKNQLLHIAAHASSGHQPNLSLSECPNDRIYRHQLSLMLKTPPVTILSACETGLGPYISGEGLQSLGQKLLEAGSQSVIQNLNKASDQYASQLMRHFYRHLQRQKDSTTALQFAKLNFLQEADAFQSHPYFWSGLVAYGKAFQINL